MTDASSTQSTPPLRPPSAPPQAEVIDALEQALQALGMERSMRFGAVVWTGPFEGRNVTLSIGRYGRTRYAGEVRYRKHIGWRLRIEMHSTVPTRLYIVPAHIADSTLLQWVYRWQGKTVIADLPGALAPFRAVARDAPWAQSLLARPALAEDLARLMTERTTANVKGSVSVEPEWLYYGSGILQPADLDAQWLTSVLQRMARIADTADALPPPARKDKTPRFAAFTRRRPIAAAFLLIGGLMAGLLILGLALVGVIISIIVALN